MSLVVTKLCPQYVVNERRAREQMHPQKQKIPVTSALQNRNIDTTDSRFGSPLSQKKTDSRTTFTLNTR
ncbi:hypothetical protein Q3G72_000784 [Acer saccharum]|nr:hypothetical protein Q3G72_000784 [Acer saccharum]